MTPNQRRIPMTAIYGYALAGCSLVAAVPTYAQDQSGSYGEIVVTAQKRAQSIQDVPISVTAVTSDDLRRVGASNISAVAKIAPNVSIMPGSINPTAISPIIRGIGTFSNEPLGDLAVAVSVDGVYLNSVYGGLISSFDVGQIEVLRGPQGTLQGRNAPGGAINITTRRPTDELEIRGEASYGRFNDLALRLAASGPLVGDKLSGKIVLMRENSQGYMRNLTDGRHFGGRDSWLGRAGLQYKDDSFNAFATVDYAEDHSPQGAMRAANTSQAYPRPETGRQNVPVACSVYGFCTPDPIYTARADYSAHSFFRTFGTTLNAQKDFGDISFNSVTGYRKLKDVTRQDLDRLPIPLYHDNNTELNSSQFSEEARLSSSAADAGGKFEWLLGAIYNRGKFNRHNVTTVRGNFNNAARYGQTTTSTAIFATLGFRPLDNLKVSVGARQTWDKKKYETFTPVASSRTKSFDNFSMEANLQYEFSRRTMAYARFAQGYTAGGFNRSGTTFKPETLDSFEVGLKSSILENRVSLNVSAFRYKYSDLQRRTTVIANGVPATEIRNAAKAEMKGLELEVQANPVDGLRLRGALGILDSKYKRYIVQEPDPTNPGSLRPVDNSALRLAFAPKWTASGEIAYEIPVNVGPIANLTPQIAFSYKSAHTTNTEDVPVEAEHGYLLVDGSLRVASVNDRISLTAFVNNVFNEHYITGAGTLGGLGNFQIDGAPRTYGLRLTFDIGR